MALFAPHANSYRRFCANSYAPLTPTWGINNRTVALRVPGGPADTRHVEHRICGADANPYLAASAVLAGVHYGMTNQIDPGPPVVGFAADRAESACIWNIDPRVSPNIPDPPTRRKSRRLGPSNGSQRSLEEGPAMRNMMGWGGG